MAQVTEELDLPDGSAATSVDVVVQLVGSNGHAMGLHVIDPVHLTNNWAGTS